MKRAILTHRAGLHRDRRAGRARRSRSSATSSSTSPSFTFGQSYYTVKARVRDALPPSPPDRASRSTIAGVQVGLVGGVQLQGGRARRDDEHLQEVRADLPQRDRAAAAPHAAEGHVPRRSTREPERRRDPDRRDARRRRARSRTSTVDQILSSLDADTRDYLLLLLARRGAGVPGSRQPRARLPSPPPSPTCAGCSSGSRRSTATRSTFTTLLASASRTSAGRSTTCSW